MSRPTIKSYEDAANFLGGADVRSTGQRGTRLVRLTADSIAVRYHDTNVVVYYGPESQSLARIDNDGWTTNTTIARINEYAPPGVEVFEDEGDLMLREQGVPGATFVPYTVPKPATRKAS